MTLLNEMSILAVMQQFAAQLRAHAKDAGTACSMPECDALTLGVRCSCCTRRICMTHAFWKIHAPRVSAMCCYCAIATNEDLFDSEETGEGDADG